MLGACFITFTFLWYFCAEYLLIFYCVISSVKDIVTPICNNISQLSSDSFYPLLYSETVSLLLQESFRQIYCNLSEDIQNFILLFIGHTSSSFFMFLMVVVIALATRDTPMKISNKYNSNEYDKYASEGEDASDGESDDDDEDEDEYENEDENNLVNNTTKYVVLNRMDPLEYLHTSPNKPSKSQIKIENPNYHNCTFNM